MDSTLLARWDVHVATSRVAIVDSAGPHTFGSLDASARQLASAILGDRASLEGERVALLVEPGALFVTALLAILRAGGCAVVLSPLHPPAESAYFLSDAGVQTVIASETLRGAQGENPPLRVSLSNPGRLRLLSPMATADARPQRQPQPQPQEDDAALQIYTSGTTGRPKGAVLTHRNLFAQQLALNEAWGMRSDDVLLHCLPLHHVHGLSIALLNVLGAGGAARMLPGFDAKSVWEALAESSVFMAVPTVYAKLLTAFDEADAKTQARWASHASSLRLSTSGSAALPVSLGDRWKALSGTFPLERYGMTEIGVALSNALAPSRRKPGSVGHPLPSVEVRVVDEAGEEGHTGELWVTGPSVFGGYFQREEETTKAFSEHLGRRWFRTGDTVERAEDGSLRILGRSSVDILKSGGYKLSALELEELLREHTSVAEVAVVGLPDEVWGQRVVACIVPEPGESCDEVTLRAWAKERVASYKVPRHVLVFDALPRNAMGKVVKPELARLVGARLQS